MLDILFKILLSLGLSYGVTDKGQVSMNSKDMETLKNSKDYQTLDPSFSTTNEIVAVPDIDPVTQQEDIIAVPDIDPIY